MIPINKQLFTLAVVYKYMSQQETWKLATILRSKQQDLEDCLDTIEERKLFDGHYEAEKEAVEAQLGFLNKNLAVLEEALLRHEAKSFEKHPHLDELQDFCLN